MSNGHDTPLRSARRRRNRRALLVWRRQGSGPAEYSPRSLRRCGPRSRPQDRPRACARQTVVQGATRMCAAGSWRVVLNVQEARNDALRTLPLTLLDPNLTAARLCQPVHFHSSSALRSTPDGVDPSGLLQLQEGGIERALIQRQLISADLFDAPRDAVPVKGSERLQRL